MIEITYYFDILSHEKRYKMRMYDKKKIDEN